ncbi:inactive CPSFs Cft2p metallobeta-lactamase [Cryptosporidium ubiquitum]|uniref:Cleavage and polyadenylation specificity factor subunit 2 n=1 Tax=Cryptosporidium ubiquitum TaxID=857276 RepID=A0A1J4MFG8_9CRYT|nr:inactive CPSFs Cft2p metallobeta-lactamase [Cryptosporidium ubiquitum]OII72953.1 inactive CPSFs Cft2p metallobeta-lactamase [Cryptosporidium ubiquitum]
MINLSLKPICSGVIKGNALRINNCLIWFDFGIENESNFDRSILLDLELPHLILLTNFPKTFIGGLPILHKLLTEKGISCKIPVICTEPVFRFGNNILSDIIQSMSIKDQERGLQYTCDKEDNKGFKQLPFTNEDIEGILGENVCRLRYYQSFNIQLLHNDNNMTDNDSSDSCLTSINLKALPSGLELGSTIWNMTINSNSDSWEFVYVSESASHPYWHVTPSDLGRLNKPDLLMFGVNTKISTIPDNLSLSLSSEFGNDLKKCNNRLISIKKFVNTILDCIRKNKTGTILIPIQLDSLLLEILCYLDAIWNKGKILYPIFVTSPLIKSFLLSVKTLIEWMSLEIRSEFCDSRFNPFHDLKNIILETNLKTIRSENLSKVPKIIFAFPESMDYGYSRELFTELATNENNTIMFIREPKENTFAHYIWNKELELRRSDQSCIHSLIHSDNYNMQIPTNILENNHELSYYIELPMIRFTPYRQDELYAMYLSHKESNVSHSLNQNSEDINQKSDEKKINPANLESDNGNHELDDINDNKKDIEMNIENDTTAMLSNCDDKSKNNNNDDFGENNELNNTTYSMLLSSNNNNNNNSSDNCSKIDQINKISNGIDYVNDHSISSSIQTKIEALRSKLVPVNVDDELLNLNSLSSSSSSSSSSLKDHNSNQNSITKQTKDDYGCLLDEQTLKSIIDSWKDASSDLDISSYNLKLNEDSGNDDNKSSELETVDQSITSNFDSSNNNDGNNNNKIHILAPRRRRNIMGMSNVKDDLSSETKEEVTLDSNGNSDTILNRNTKHGARLLSMLSIDSNNAVPTSNIPEWRIHFRQILGGTEPFRISHEMSKIEIRSRVILTDGLELKNEIPSLLPLLNCSNPKTIILLSDCKDSKEENILRYYKSLLMSLPNSPKNIVSSKISDNNLIEFTLDKSVKIVSFDNSVWDDVSTGGFQLVQNGSAPSAALQESSLNNNNSISSYYAFARIDNISAKLLKNNEVIFVKNNKLENNTECNHDKEKVMNVSDSLINSAECQDFIDESLVSKNYQSPYSVLNNLIDRVKKKECYNPSRKKFHKEILLSKSRGIRHIVSEMRKQNPLPIINISPNGGIVSVNNAIAFSSNHLNKNFQISRINCDDQNNSSFNVQRGDHLTSNSNTDDMNIWNLHATLHPYYYIARGILRNQFAIL